MPKPITETLYHLGAGALMDDAAERLAELVKEVDQTGKAGSLTIKITLRKASANALAASGEVAAKMPKRAPIEALLFPTPEGNLLTEDPRQSKLELRAVAEQPRELKTITA